MVMGIIFGVLLFMYGTYVSYNEVASEEDFEFESSGDLLSYRTYLCTIEGDDLGTDVFIYMESDANVEIEVYLSVYAGDEEIEYSGWTSIEKNIYIGTVDEVEFYIEIYGGYDIDDLSISIETNNSHLEVCMGASMSISCFLIGLPLGIILLVFHFKNLRTGSLDKKYDKEIKDLEKKVREMEKLGLNTTKERKLLEGYKRE